MNITLALLELQLKFFRVSHIVTGYISPCIRDKLYGITHFCICYVNRELTVHLFISSTLLTKRCGTVFLCLCSLVKQHNCQKYTVISSGGESKNACDEHMDQFISPYHCQRVHAAVNTATVSWVQQQYKVVVCIISFLTFAFTLTPKGRCESVDVLSCIPAPTAVH